MWLTPRNDFRVVYPRWVQGERWVTFNADFSGIFFKHFFLTECARNLCYRANGLGTVGCRYSTRNSNRNRSTCRTTTISGGALTRWYKPTEPRRWWRRDWNERRTTVCSPSTCNRKIGTTTDTTPKCGWLYSFHYNMMVFINTAESHAQNVKFK